MSDLVSDKLVDEIKFIVVEVVDKPLDIDTLDFRVDTGSLDEFRIIVDAYAICYADILGDFVDVC
jgi:hypothetical protein